MTLRKVAREVTEAAIHYLHATYADHAHYLEIAPPPTGRVLTTTTALGAYDSRSASFQGCFLRLVSIVEAYVDVVASAVFRERTSSSDELVRRLVESAELLASNTWHERQEAFERYHNIRLGQFACWSELTAAIEVRNAIAHGLGHLTPRQRGTKAERRIPNIGVAVSDGRIVLSEANLRRCRDVCISFVKFLDEAVAQVTGPPQA